MSQNTQEIATNLWRPLISVIIPTRKNERIEPTMDSLMQQTIQDFEIHTVVDYHNRGQSWARNRGAECARGAYLLFSDTDIKWRSNAVALLLHALKDAQRHEPDRDWRTAYAYGAYEFEGLAVMRRAPSDPMPGTILGNQEWDWVALLHNNFISTMSLVETDAFRAVGGFDEELRRLEDWDLWLRLGQRKYRGAYVADKILFTTTIRSGISYDNPMSHEEAMRIVKSKFGITV